MIKFFIFLSIALWALAKAENATQCEFNKACLCVKESDKVYASVSCLDVTSFPKFTNVPEGTSVKTFLVSGKIEYMPHTGFENFSHVSHATIERYPLGAFVIEDRQLTALTNCSIDGLKLIGFHNLLPPGSVDLGIDPNTLDKLSALEIERSSARLDDTSFRCMTALKQLALRNNGADIQLRTGNVRPFRDLGHNLEELDLSGTKLSPFSEWKAVLDDLVNLKALLLGHSQISDLADANFTHFKFLQILGLSGNPDLRKLNGFDTQHPSLKELYLDECGFTEIPHETLKNLGSLEKLHMANNTIEKLTRDQFLASANHLDTLILDGNPIQHVDEGTFKDLVALQNFSVKGWDLDVLDLSIFGTWTTGGGVRELQVRENTHLHTINVSNPTMIPTSLRNVHVSGNNLSVIDESVGQLLEMVHFTMHISNEFNFYCPGREISHVSTSTAGFTTGASSTTDQSTKASSTNAPPSATGTPAAQGTTQPLATQSPPVTTHATTTPNMDRSLTWLAKEVVCTKRIILTDDVLCAQAPGEQGNGTKVHEYLRSLNPDCSAITGGTTPSAITGTGTGSPSKPTTTGGSALSCRLFEILLPFASGLLITRFLH